jgi:hypothetical protein
MQDDKIKVERGKDYLGRGCRNNSSILIESHKQNIFNMRNSDDMDYPIGQNLQDNKRGNSSIFLDNIAKTIFYNNNITINSQGKTPAPIYCLD